MTPPTGSLPVAWGTCPSPWGELQVAATARGVLRVALPGEDAAGWEEELRRLLARPGRAVWPGGGPAEGAEPQPASSPGEFGAAAAAEGWLAEALRELAEYGAGHRTRFGLPLDLRGTPFQIRVWEALLAIPCGEVRTYGQVARAVGQPGACRAVGRAVGANPLAILVPCHRVVRSHGQLGHYGGGPSLKRALLLREGYRGPELAS